MNWRKGSWVGATTMVVSLVGGCSGNCEDDGLAQDDPANCAAASGDDGSGGSSGGPPIPIDTDGTGSGTTGDSDSNAGSDTDTDTDSGSETDTDTGAQTETDSDAETDTAGDLCTNGVLDEGEADVDCGGVCDTPCDDGDGCTEPSDCASGVCDEGTCAAPTCEDGVRNGDETDVDCGGDTCGPCDDGQMCLVPADCISEVCTGEVCVAPTCEDDVQNGDETDVDCGGDTCEGCEDGESCVDDDDCVSNNCVDEVCLPIPESCLELLLTEPDAADGFYEIDPDGPGGLDPFDVECDMTTDGGGWTGITPCIAQSLSGTLVAVEPAAIEGVDGACRPFTQDAGNQFHTYHYTFTFAPTFTEFYLADYQAQANGSGPGNTADIGPFVQSVWDDAHQGTHGDISFGSADDAGPVTSFAAEGTDVDTTAALVPWPASNASYGVGAASSDFRIGWGEEGSQSEGWIPWADGSVFIR